MHNTCSIKELFCIYFLPFSNKALPDGFVTSPILLKDAPTVQICWNTFAAEHRHCISTLESIECLIQNSLTSCVYTSDGIPASWILLHLSGAEMAGCTQPKYRGMGLLPHVGIYLHEKSREIGLPHVHAIVAVGNTSMQTFMEVSFKTIPGHVTFYHYIPN